MTTHFLRNLYLGSQLTDEEAADIPHYRAELHCHVLYKNIQAGSILGMGIIGPLVGLIRGRSFAAMKAASYKGGKIACGILVPLSPVMTEMTIRNATEEAIYDRSFRIRKNVGQVRADRYSTYGALVGMGATKILGSGILPGFMMGAALGAISSGVYGQLHKDQK